MLKSLSISNYAIINQLEIDFSKGLNIITGETGAGKSILLGALSLLLGQRADSSVLKNNDKKCVVEGVFDIGGFDLDGFFTQNDLDFEVETIIRREIGTNGKSRAFINDVPVNLGVLKLTGLNLIDIHSQHQNLNLQDNTFQLKVVDTLANNSGLLKDFNAELKIYNQLKKELSNLKSDIEKLKGDKEYLEFQYIELDKAALIENELEELEEELKTLSHAEEIKELLEGSCNVLSVDEINILEGLKGVSKNVEKLSKLLPSSENIFTRLDSIYIDLKDINQEIEILNEKINVDPDRLAFVNDRLNLIYNLQQKHRLTTVLDLISFRDELKDKLDNIFFSDEKLSLFNQKIVAKEQVMYKLAEQISDSRKKVVPSIEKDINKQLIDLGMPYSTFKINLQKKLEFTSTGIDELQFLYSPGKEISFQDLGKVASGGEMSRLMLSIKALINKFINLPTIVFDEIDTGVSGEIADKMGDIIKKMSSNMQVINITHLPQVASKGDYHFLVHKTNENNITETRMKLLSDEERITEVAKMLSGAVLTEAAVQNAKELLSK